MMSDSSAVERALDQPRESGRFLRFFSFTLLRSLFPLDIPSWSSLIRIRASDWRLANSRHLAAQDGTAMNMRKEKSNGVVNRPLWY